MTQINVFVWLVQALLELIELSGYFLYIRLKVILALQCCHKWPGIIPSELKTTPTANLMFQPLFVLAPQKQRRRCRGNVKFSAAVYFVTMAIYLSNLTATIKIYVDNQASGLLDRHSYLGLDLSQWCMTVVKFRFRGFHLRTVATSGDHERTAACHRARSL